MFTYANTRLCPSCRDPLPQPVAADHACVRCGVPVGHPLAGEVFATLQRADALVARLRATRTPEPAPPRIPSVAWTPSTTRSVSATPPRTGVRASSVPAILLGLGALCLLVAAVTFLAVAWSWLGVGGRTIVLATLTIITAAAGKLLEARGLRIAAESLVAVALGMLLLDVVGAARAGWFDLDEAGLVLTAGLVLAAGAAVLVPGPRRLAVPQAVAVLGLLVAQGALPFVVDHRLLIGALAAAGYMGLAVLVRDTADLAVVKWVAVVAAALAWADLTLTALGRLTDLDTLTVSGLWGSGTGPALLAGALLLLTPAGLDRSNTLLQLVTTASATMLTGLVVLPVLDNGVDHVAVTSLVAGGLWTVVAHAVPRSHLAVPTIPAALSLLPAAFVALTLGGQALDSALTPTAGLRLDPPDPVASPWLLLPSVVSVVALLLVLAPRTARGTTALRVALAVLLLAGAATLALHAVPLWTLVVAVGLGAAAYAVDALRRDDLAATVQALAAGSLLLATLPVASPSTALLLVPLGLLAATAAAVLFTGRFPGAAEVGGLTLPPALAGLTWVLADLAGLDAARAVPVLVVLSAVAIGHPRAEVEVTAALAGLAVAASAVPLASDETLSLAVHLTLAGALVVLHALVHPSRRPLAWVGSALLVLATWVRLVDVGADAPELYTMPTAIALLVVGLRRMRRDETSSTALALLPALLLATVPSFLHAAAHDPVSLRAALLGLGCLALTVGGAQLRWSAPLLVGATIGGLLALVELAPYAAATPQWVVIGLAGTVLVVAGTTWERRVVELQRATAYVGRLR